MTALGRNNLLTYFLCSQCIFLPITFYNAPLLSQTVNTNKAIWLHMIGLFWSGIGYYMLRFAEPLQKVEIEGRQYVFQLRFYLFSYLFLVTGLMVSIMQVALGASLMEHFSNMLSSDFEAGIRDAYLLSSDEGGLPGIVKMFGYSPLSIYLMSLGLLNFVNLSSADRHKFKYLSGTALVAVLIKIFFSLDRLSIMAVLLANIFLGIEKGYLRKLRYWALIGACLLVADYVSAKRLEGYGIIYLTLIYLKLGLVNFQLMIDTCSRYTYGFSTFLSPFYFILKFFRLPLPDIDSGYDWDWNPAQFFSSYAFQDFGYFYFVEFFLIGMVLYRIQITLLQRNLYSSAIYFIALYGIVSFAVVPAIRGVDFWLSLLIPLFLVRYFSRSVSITEGHL